MPRKPRIKDEVDQLAKATVEKDAPKKENPEKAFIALALKRFQLAAEAEGHIREQALDDLRFRTGDQWPEAIKTQRSRDGRPCLEMDQIEKFIRQVCNEERQQRPAIQVNPVGDGADQDTAEIEQGLIRHIEVQSKADIARDHAFEMMISIGFGYYRLLIEDDELTGDLEIRVKRIKNPFTVYFDPNCQEPDYSDARWAFIVQDMPREEYKAQFPDSQMSNYMELSSTGDAPPGWVTKDDIRVAEYFYVDGEGKNRKVKWSKINAVEVLDKQDWVGKWIPILAVLGTDLDIDGKRFLAGMVRKLKDPQRQYNYMISAATEAIALAPKAPFVAAEGQLENHETEWKLANIRNFPVLQYKPIGLNGATLPPPQRSNVEPPIQAMTLMVRQANEDLQGAAGIYNPSLGAPSSDHSGKAILARQKQSDITNLNWTDNLARTIGFEGKMLLDLIPKVYTEAKVRRIINPDGTATSVGIVNTDDPEQAAAMAKELEQVESVYNIGVGSYDVSVSVGPSYQSKRQEAVASQLALIQSVPQIVGVAGDILVGNMDWPGAPEIAKRLKKMLPPQLQEEAGDPESQMQQLQAQAAQMQQMLQQQGQLLQQQHEIVQGKLLEQQTKKDIESMRIGLEKYKADLDAATRISVAQETASKDTNESFAQREAQTLEQFREHAHELAIDAQQHQHAMELGQQQADQAQQAAVQQAALQPQPEQAAQ